MAINTHHHGEHTAPSTRQWMLRPGLVCSRVAIVRCHPVEHPAGAASRPAAGASQATVAPAPPHSVVLITALQLASSSALGALFAVAPTLRVSTLSVLSARTPSRPVAAAFQAKMVAPAHSVAGLVSPAIKPAYSCSGAAPVEGGRGEWKGERTGRWRWR